MAGSCWARILAIGAVVGLSQVGTQASAIVRETTKNTTYVVRGETAPDVRKDMSAKGPQGYDGFTTWHIRWNYRFQATARGCAIGDVTVSLAIAFTMPRLESRNSVLKASFDAYVAKLQKHEDGHAENGRSVARRIEKGIAGMSAGSCDDLQRDANLFGDRAIDDGKALDAEYDRQTRHGETQGAVWP